MCKHNRSFQIKTLSTLVRRKIQNFVSEKKKKIAKKSGLSPQKNGGGVTHRRF
jgi:hypothetical protein